MTLCLFVFPLFVSFPYKICELHILTESKKSQDDRMNYNIMISGVCMWTTFTWQFSSPVHAVLLSIFLKSRIGPQFRVSRVTPIQFFSWPIHICGVYTYCWLRADCCCRHCDICCGVTKSMRSKDSLIFISSSYFSLPWTCKQVKQVIWVWSVRVTDGHFQNFELWRPVKSKWLDVTDWFMIYCGG